MIYFLAWVVVGFCSAMITSNKLNQHLGKHGRAIFAHVTVNGLDEPLAADEAAFISSKVDIAHAIIGVIASPLALYSAIIYTFKPEKFDKFKVVIDEYVKIHGAIE
jgi:hypothetical protein